MPKNNRSAAGQRRIMQAIRSKNTKPELRVRSLLHNLGYRFNVHAPDLPGRPDIVFRARSKAIFVHGCFWHGHEDPNCPDGRRPVTNTHYWLPKLEKNVTRDQAAVKALTEAGWGVLVLWACKLGDEGSLIAQMRAFLGGKRHQPIYESCDTNR